MRIVLSLTALSCVSEYCEDSGYFASEPWQYFHFQNPTSWHCMQLQSVIYGHLFQSRPFYLCLFCNFQHFHLFSNSIPLFPSWSHCLLKFKFYKTFASATNKSDLLHPLSQNNLFKIAKMIWFHIYSFFRDSEAKG